MDAADWEGGAAAAAHLVGLGQRRLAYVTDGPEKPSFAARARGFRHAATSGTGSVDVEEWHIDRDEPSDVGTALAMMPGIVGFYGASSAERLPTERASKAQVAEFEALRLV